VSKSIIKYTVVLGVSTALLSLIVGSEAKVSPFSHVADLDELRPTVAVDTPPQLKYPYKDKSVNDPLTNPNSGGLKLNDPSNVKTKVEYNPATGNYDINQKIGDMNYRPPTYLDADDYQKYMFNKQVKNYWNQKVHAQNPNNKNNTVIPKLNVGGEVFDRIFGGNQVDIRPNGSAELIFAYNGTKTKNPSLPARQQKVNTFNFDQKIQLNVIGKIGDKLKLTTSYNTEATFDFENQMKLEYTGYEDEIIKKIEAGNVSMPLKGSLITGSQTLFGVKTQLQFGRLMVTSILSQQKGKKSEVDVAGGAQINRYEIAGNAYEYNKHYFLSGYFRDNYDQALANLPFVNSQVLITRIEVWVSNTNGSTTDIRNVVGFTELGEDGSHIPPDIAAAGYITDANPGTTAPDNAQNTLYGKVLTNANMRTVNTTVSEINKVFNNTLKQQSNYELFTARKLQPSEYTLNAKLGYISLNQQLNPEQVLSVAYQYTINGVTYQVGELSDGGVTAPQALFAKMLKSSNTVTSYYSTTLHKRIPSELWNLMMKNIYAIGSYQINAQDFKLDVYYNNAGTDINYLPVQGEPKITSKPLLQVLSLDKLNQQSDQTPDGVFDFIDGVTINANNGRIIFPVVEPFGDYLRKKFTSATNADAYVFDALYDSTRTYASTQATTVDKFRLKGQYQSSSSSEISLGAPNVPQGSVTVTAGGMQLTENVDYTVDYTLGRVKIINEGVLNSGTPIKVSLESNALFAIQSKTLLGTHLDYRINKDFTVGATIMNLTERPVTKKINVGDEPISNTIWGFDGDYKTEAPFLTRLVDKIPLIETKESSSIAAGGEFAYLVPGHSKAIGKSGNSYVDDFEGSQSTIDLKAPGAWSIASTPQRQGVGSSTHLFPEGDLIDTVASGFNRALLTWYQIDNLFTRQTNNLTPSNITATMMSNNFMREVPEQEVFPNKQTATVSNIATLDLAYYPSERGPYNYDVTPSPISAGLDANGNLSKPATRWGGMMRSLQTTDFEAANVEYIQFWVMDPFNSDLPAADRNVSGDLYFDIGNISEDVLRDSYKSAENVLPAPSTKDQNGGNNLPVVETAWGRIPTTQPLVNAFNSEPGDRVAQDVGLDGLDNAAEQNFFASYLSKVNAFSPSAYAKVVLDPSADDFHYFRGDDYDPPTPTLNTLERYKKYVGLEGNSPVTSGEYSKASFNIQPNVEDINRDNNLSTFESYYQYHISLKPSDFAAGVGNNYITDVVESKASVKDGSTKLIKWYQFKIPLKTAEAEKFGDIENFQSIRFMRMFFKNVDKPIVMRFARLELVRGEWRKYGFDLSGAGVFIPTDDNNVQFNISAVNLEENGSKQPVNYVLPPGIEREINSSSAKLLAINEQAMALTVCGLKDGDARAAYKTTQLDVRQYQKLKMYVHAEASTNIAEPLKDNDLHMFIRLGTDYTDNYYEYDVPLKVTPPGNYNGSSESDQYAVWPQDNEMILEFSKLQAAKLKRNNDIGIPSSGVTLTSEYKVSDNDRMITVKGNPNLSAVRIIMIGIRNPMKKNATDPDDGKSKCAQIWVNELRLSDFTENGGWAANAHVTAKLADFGNLSLSGNMYTPGFGSIENKVNERKKETLKQYDLSSSLELGKFIPQALNVHIPMYVGYSEIFITPQYNPLDPDILLAPVLKDPEVSQKRRDSLRFITQDYTKRRSLNFTNVKKDKGKNSKKSHIYDVENWAATYSYSELYHRNTTIEYNSLKDYHGGLIYSYTPTPKNIKPFDKIKFLQPKYFQLIKDVNFFLYPNKLGFSTNVDREYTTAKTRNTTGSDILILPTFNKRFNMNRNYDFNYDITKALKLNFTAINLERVLEPDGAVTPASKDTLKREFFDRVKKTQYNQQVNLTYTIPINKLPLLDFATANVNYGGTYNWTHSPLFDTQKDSEGHLIHKDTLGNTITNSRSIRWNGQFNMTTLYNKVPYFKRVNQNIKKKPDPKDSKTAADSTKKKKPELDIMRDVARLIMTLKTVSLNYSTTDGMILPGYGQNMQALGMDEHFAGPTFGFTVGSQNDIRKEAEQKGWLQKSSVLNTPYQVTKSEDLKIRANAEPFKDFKVELTAARTKSLIRSQAFRWNVDSAKFFYDPAIVSGAFNMSFFTLKTSFQKGDNVFAKFLEAREVISGRLGAINKNSNAVIDGYSKGYNATSQDVLIPAFLSAYSGTSADRVGLSPFPKVPKPNWRVTYDGLSKKDLVKKYFKSITLANGYTSMYSVGGFTHNPLHTKDAQGFTDVFEIFSTVTNNPNFLPENLITTVTISEQWSPFLKIDVTLHNSLAFNIEYKKDRTLSLGLSSRTITEISGREIVGGTGYRIKDVKLGNNLKIKGKPIKSDLNLNLNVSFRKNQTVIRKIEEGVSQPTGGTNVISIKASADYIINERITVKAFFERIMNIPVISSSFPTTNTNAGISLRLTLSN
jgi:cell surface protein SprA